LTISPGVRGLIFDVDGTLADTMPIHYQAWRQILAEAGIDYPLDMFYELAGMPTRAIVPVVNRRFGVGLDPDVTARRKERLFAGRLREVAPIEPVVALVRRHAGLLPMGIGTGGGRTLISRILDVVGLTGYFEVIVTAEDVASPKPAPDTWLLCAAGMGVPPELCQVFEDGELGLVAARRAGMIATDVRPFLRVPSGQPQGGMREEMP
jgi:beta-phosphoglucomutase-like phosphatase (HAD superfamily)